MIKKQETMILSEYIGDAMFKIPTPLMLSKIVDAGDKLEIKVNSIIR
ncbi:hypothetical protein [Clostridium frigidicarnis]|uniref:Uncharacterized protein n=1 Tax=Clostridium frigidicarnis TaxID=84698 RepID=A0A1I0Y3Y8_9CLOT|nr:hypothetical protein [Clostridium frigidicarnis]SFB08065.1 hypothetical protein SAMN04488528_101125 [Clostridium frigidicarnis]